MARLIRSIRQWPPLQHHHCCSRITLYHFLFSPLLPLTISTKTPSHCFSFATSTSFHGNARHRPRGIRLPNAPSPSDLQESESSDDSESDVNKSRNQKKREARRAVRWGVDLASFSTSQIKRILRVASLEEDVFDALTLVKATKVGDQKTLQALAGSKMQIMEEEEEEEEEDDDYESEYSKSEEFVNIANGWFDGLISKDMEITNEVYSVSSVDFDRQELRKLVRRVQTILERRQIETEEEKAKIEAAVTSAKKSLNRFLRTLAKQLPD